MATVSWKPNAAGDWSTAADWSTGALPGTTDTVVLTSTTARVITHSTGADTIAALSATNDSLSVTGGSLAVTGAASLGAGLTVTGGALSFGGGTGVTGAFKESNGTVTVGIGAALTLSGATTWSGGYLVGPGGVTTSSATSVSGTFYLDGSLVWTNSGTLSDGGTLYLSPSGVGSVAITNTATHAFNITADGSAVVSGNGTGTINNAGTLSKTIGSGTSTIGIAVANTGTLTATTGTLELDGGGSLGGTIGATKTGTLAFAAGTFTLSGTTQTISGPLLLDGGVVSIGSGQTLTLSGATTLSSGSITGSGTIANTGTFTFGSGSIVGDTIQAGSHFTISNNGTLSGVSYQGTLNLPDDTSVTIQNGITLSGTGGTGAATINLTGAGAYLYYQGTGSLNNAAIAIGNAGYYGQELITSDTTGTGAVLTLGTATSVTQAGTYAFLSDTGNGKDGIVNSGTVTAGVSGGNFVVNGNSFSNTGAISVSNGDTLSLGSTTSTNKGTIALTNGSLTGSLTNAGTVSLNGTVGLNGTIQGGVVTGGATTMLTGGTFSGITYRGMLADSAAVTIQNGITLTGTAGTGAGTISLTSPGAGLTYQGTGTLNNAAVSIGGATYEGQELYAYDSTGTGAVLTLGTSLNIIQAGTYVYLSDSGYAKDGIVNSGTITASVAGGNFIVGGNSFSNTGTIAASAGDTLTLSSTTSTNKGSLKITGATLAGSLTNTGTVTLSGTVALNGTIQGGIVSAGTTTVLTGNDTLAGVTYRGALTLGNGDATTIQNGITLTGTAGTGAGTLNITGVGSYLYYIGTGTLDNAAITIGNATENYYGQELIAYDPTDTGAVLTLGTATSLTQAGTYAYMSDYGGATDGIVNNGTMTLGAANGDFAVTGHSFANAGLIALSKGDMLDISGTTFTNKGTVSLTGSIGVSGTISGGVVTGGTSTSITGSPTLSGVTYLGTLGLTAGADVFVQNGITLAGAGGTGAATISLTGVGSYLYYTGTGTLDNAAITIGNATENNYGQELIAYDPTATGAVLTLGTATSVTQAGTYAYMSDYGGTKDGIVNNGTMTLGVANGDFGVTGHSFANAGLIALSNGDTLDISATTFTNKGTVSLTGSVGINGTISGGVITGGTVTSVMGSPTFSGVTYLGTLGLTTGTSLFIQNGITLAGAGGTGAATINLTGVGSYIYYTGTGTLDNAAITIGNASQNNYGQELIAYDPTSTGAILTLGTATSVTQAGTYAYMTDYGGTKDGIINNGAITAGVAGGFFDINGHAFTNGGTITVSNGDTLDISSTSFTNKGSVFLSGGTLTVDGTGAIVNAGAIVKNAGTTTNAFSNTITNTGTLAATVGTLELDGGASLTGTLGAPTGTGTVLLAAGSFTTTGTVTIADDGTTTGVVLGSGETWSDSGTILDAGHLALGSTTATGSPAILAIAKTGALDLTSNDAMIAGKGTASITNAGTIAATAATGAHTISVGVANTGLIDAGVGTLALTGSITGTGNLKIEAGGTLELGQTLSTTQTITFNGAGATLKIDKPASLSKALVGLGVGDRIDLAGVTLTAAGVSGNTLTLSNGTTTYTYVSSASLATDRAQFASDGAGGTMVTLYSEAVPTAHTPEPVAFGKVHVGDTAIQTLSLGNSAPAGSYSEALDAGLTGATTGFTTAGTITGLAGGATNSTALTITESTTTAGTLSGTATLGLVSDGTGIDGLATTALPSQAVTMSGSVYAYAAPTLSATTVALGAARVGGTLAAGAVTLKDGATASPYQESLIYGTTAASGVTITGGAGTIASGGGGTLGFKMGTATAGSFAVNQAVTLTSTGVGTSGLANTTLAAQSVSVTAKVYAPAVATLTATTVNFGIVHVGDTTAALQSLAVTNTGTGGLVDLLTAGTATTTGAVSGATYALGTGLASGTAGSVQLGLNTTTSGTVAGTAVLGFTSHDSDLADLALAGQTVSVTGTVDNYAVAQVEQTGGAGTMTQTGNAYVINLGTVAQNGTAVAVDLGVLNAATGTADVLGGTFAASGSTAFTNTGLTAFSGLTAGTDERGQVVTLNTGTAGVFTETIVVTPTGSNASGYSGVLASDTITLTGTVVSVGTTYTLTSAPMTIAGTTGNDIVNAATNTLNSRDSIDGATGTNTLNLVGGGFFDLGAPKKLADIQTVTAQESTGGTTVYMRDSLNVTLNVLPSGTGSLTVYGGADSDIYNLGAGTDTVVLGATTEVVHSASGGVALVQATAAQAAALVTGGTTGTTTLELTTGSTPAVALNAGDSNLIVKLDAATNLSLGAATFITVVGAAAGKDTLTAGGTSQTLTSIGGNDVLVGSSSYGDTFLGTSAGFLGDTIKLFGGTDTIDVTDLMSASIKLSYTGTTTSGKLVATDGSHTATLTMSGNYTLANFVAVSDGHGGTQIGFVQH